jgi:hypothetical protein
MMLGAMALVSFFPRDLIFNHSYKPKNTQKYAAVLYIASHTIDFRQQAASQISDIIEIHFGGSCHVPTKDPRNGKIVKLDGGWPGNSKFYSDYKYCMVMENSQVEGYITEKLINAYLGGCLPIYYGTEEVFEIFNAKSFIFYDINNPQPALDEIQYLQQNDTAYKERMNAPILRNGAQTIDEFFSISDDLGNGTLKRKIRTMLGLPP